MRPAEFIRPAQSFTRANSRQSYAKPLDYACFTAKIHIIICLSERFENSRRHIGLNFALRCVLIFHTHYIYMCIRHDMCVMCARRARCVELLQIIYPASFSYLPNEFLRATVSVFSGWEASKRACDNREKSAADKEKMIRRPVSPCRQVPHINSFIYICSSLNTERGA